jgi:tetratricopeptide (TPR) repeat protein
LSRPLIFISYSHRDEDWKDRILLHLGVAQKQERFDLWDDRRIEGGEDWFEAITNAIDAGCVGILLVSANSLTSDFILKEEVPRLIEKHGAGKLRLYPIIIKPCNWKAVEWLKKMNLRPADGRPVGLTKDDEVTETKIDLDLAKIAEEIDALIKKTTVSAVSSHPLTTTPDDPAPRYARTPTLPSPKPFVGRIEHLARIEEKLRSNGVIGLISLKGMPGIGKSALALESAYRFAHLFPGGRYWVDLRSGDATNAVRALLRDLEISNLVSPDAGFEEMCNVARAELINRRALIILDNAETIDSTPLERLADLCATTIVTSRVSFDPTTDILVDKLEDEDALGLLQRLGINIDAERVDALKLITRLGGLALALEITAKRMATYTTHQSCAEALAELNDSRHLVEAIMLPRHDTREGNIAEAFALSYRKLDDDLKSAFHALGLCAESGAPLEAVARMIGLEPGAARNLLLFLAEWSLTNFSGKRAVLHPLLHSYAGMCARQLPERMAKMTEQHVRYFGWEIGGAYRRAVNDEDGEGQLLALMRADSEIENVLLAQIRALEDGVLDHKMAVNVSDDLTLYWQRRYAQQLYDWLLKMRRLAQQTGQNIQEANALKAIGDVQSFRDDKDAALAYYDQALELFKQVGDKVGQANALRAIGDVQSFRKEIDAALASYDQALELYKQVGDKLGQANVRLSKGEMTNDPEEFEEAIRLYEQIGDRYSIARGKAHCGSMLMDSGESERGVKLLGEAREGWTAIKYESGVQWIDKLLSEKEKGEDDE